MKKKWYDGVKPWIGLSQHAKKWKLSKFSVFHLWEQTTGIKSINDSYWLFSVFKAIILFSRAFYIMNIQRDLRFSILKTFMSLLDVLFLFLLVFPISIAERLFPWLSKHYKVIQHSAVNILLKIYYESYIVLDLRDNSDLKCEKFLPLWNLCYHRKKIVCLKIAKKTRNTNLPNRWLKGWIMDI